MFNAVIGTVTAMVTVGVEFLVFAMIFAGGIKVIKLIFKE